MIRTKYQETFVALALATIVIGGSIGGLAANEAINHGALAAVCEGSLSLKQVPKWAEFKLREASDTVADLEDKIFKLRYTIGVGNTSESPAKCADPEATLLKAASGLTAVEKRLSDLTPKILRLNALAGFSSGRLDEFVMAFVQPVGSSQSCVTVGTGALGTLPKVQELPGCFTGEPGTALSEGNLKVEPVEIKGREKVESFSLEGELNKMGYEQIKGKLAGTASSGCTLLKTDTTSALLDSTKTTAPIKWGGGVLKIGDNFDGDIATDGLGSDSDPLTTHLRWVQNPTTGVPHLKNVNQAFKEVKKEIEELLESAAALVDSVSGCISKEHLDGQRSGQDDFLEHHRRLRSANMESAKELNESRKLLARYRDEKGDLKHPSQKGVERDSALSMSQSITSYAAFQKQIALLIASF